MKMKILMSGAALSMFTLSSPAVHAAKPVLEVSCKTDQIVEGKAPTLIEFELEDMDYGGGEYVRDKDGNALYRTTPENSVFANLVSDYTISSPKGRLILQDTNDGCQEVTLKVDLTTASRGGIAKGSIRSKDLGCGAPNAKATLSCTVRAVNR